MNQLASPFQLRMSLLRWALFVVPAVLLLGYLSGAVVGMGQQNGWFDELVKPGMPIAGSAFGVAWLIFYFLVGLAFSMVLNARGARQRGLAITLLLFLLLLTLSWAPVFFGRHQVTSALYIIVAALAVATIAAIVAGRVRKQVIWLMLPVLCWLCYVAYINFQVDQLNPDAEGLYVPAATSQIRSAG